MCKRLRENPSLNGRIDRLHRNITAWPNTVLASFDLAPPQPRQALRTLALGVEGALRGLRESSDPKDEQECHMRLFDSAFGSLLVDCRLWIFRHL
jgi:hypothetical protein